MNILFSLCWLGEPWRLERNLKWLEFQRSIKNELGYNKIIFVDNASNIEDLKKLNGNIYNSNFELIYKADNDLLDIYRFDEHLTRTGVWEYSYCWRGLDFVKTLIKKYNPEKIIFLDTDYYVLSSKLANYIKTLDSGWVTFWCNKYNFPEAALHILCKDTFDKLLNLDIPSWTYYNGKHMEFILPFTTIHKDVFKGDRYGEGSLPQTDDMDYYGQFFPGSVELKFNYEKN